MSLEAGFRWHLVGNRKSLPLGKDFLVWIPDEKVKLTIVRAVEMSDDHIVIYYADDAMLDARPRYVTGATHWADYPKGPTYE